MNIQPCDDLDAYLDDSLAGVDRPVFEQHLLACLRCQEAMEDALQLLAAGTELSRRASRPRVAAVIPLDAPPAMSAISAIPGGPGAPGGAAGSAGSAGSIDAVRRASQRRRQPSSRWLVMAGAAAGVVALLLMGRLRQPPLEDQIYASLAPHRSMLERLPYAPLDRYRPYDTPRGARDPEPISFQLTGEVEGHRPAAALAAVLLARRDLDQAEVVLARAGHDDELDIDRAVLALARNHHADALRYLDEVLARSPGNGLARWNRARVLTELRLPLAASDDFHEVAGRGEPGWSLEAVQRLSELRLAEAARSQRWYAAKAACEHLAAATLPDRQTIRANTPVCRPAFYEAVRVAASRDDVLALLPVAEELDAAAGNVAATRLVREVAAIDGPARQRAVAAYVRLTRSPDLAVAEKRRLLDQLRAANQGDLVLAAIRRAELPGWRDEYVARAAASQDPFYIEVVEERTAELRFDGGDPLGAEVELRRAVDRCSRSEVELRCSYLHLALAIVYGKMHRPSDERAVAQAGLERSRRLGLYWDERQFYDYLAEAARAEGAHALMRVYLREATLRTADECAQVRYHQETLAMASLDELRFAQARRDLTQAPACDGVPTPEGALAVAELARIDGTAGEAAALRAGLVRARQAPGQTPGQLAYLDAIEGRLLAARDPGAARPLLQRAIEAADRAGRLDMFGVKARADAYASLLILSAQGGDHASTLALFAGAAGTPPGGPCAVGVMVDDERVLVVTRDGRGTIAQHFDPVGRRAPELDAASLIPAPLVRALSGCARIDVLALPPVFGRPNLLPPELAWSYRGRSAPPEAPPSHPPHVVTVTDAVPPRELDLPPLQALALTPIPQAIHTELRGPQATPAAVLSQFAGADVVEIHAHGFIDLARSDASLIALSPQADGRFTLSAREVFVLSLPRAPLVILAACHAAYTAPYRHEPWGLPHAFLLAGARAVIASPETISDAEAGGFFRAVEQRILAGADPAIALRDERVRRLARDPSSWTHAVLLFD